MSEGHHHLLTDAIDDAVGGPARRRVIVLLGSILGLQAADTGAVGALAAPLEKSFHIGNTDIGLLVTVTTLVGCVATLPFGTIADRYNRTRLLQVVVALWAVATIVSSLSVSFAMLLVTRLALGGVIAAAGPALASLFGDLVPGDERSRLWGYVLTGELLGAGIGILVAGGLSGPFGWRVAMGCSGPAGGVSGLGHPALVARARPRRPGLPARGRRGDRDRGRQDGSSPSVRRQDEQEELASRRRSSARPRRPGSRPSRSWCSPTNWT